jgi:hypothetical protein
VEYYRIYSKAFISSEGNQAGLGGYRAELTGFPQIFNIELD